MYHVSLNPATVVELASVWMQFGFLIRPFLGHLNIF